MIITEAEAIKRAKEAVEENGWDWVEPIEVTWRSSSWFGKRGKWEIFTNTLIIGAWVRIVIDDEGQILEQDRVPRQVR